MRYQLLPNDPHTEKVLAFFHHADVPVIVRHPGGYPRLADDEGKPVVGVPCLVIIYQQTIGIRDGERVKLTASAHIQCHAGIGPGGRFMTFSGWQTDFEPTAELTPGLDELRAYLDDAVELLKDTPRKYQAAYDRIAQARQYPGPLTRDEYERACEELGIDALPDERSFVGYTYDYPTYSADHILMMHLAIARQHGISDEIKALGLPERMDRYAYEHHCAAHGVVESSDRELTHTVWAQLPSAGTEGLKEALDKARVIDMHRDAEKAPVKPTGQLWENCPRCSQKPIYMPLHLCLACWPD